MSQTPKTVGIDIGKNSFHVVGHDERGAIVLRQKWSRGQLEARLPTCRRVKAAGDDRVGVESFLDVTKAACELRTVK
jgi:hypothetical protein